MGRRKYDFYRRKDEKPKTDKVCDHEGCNEPAYFKAPKDRTLTDYYWFCEKHIKEYNESWDFYRGLSDAEIEKEIASSYVWDRPTRKFGTYDAHRNFLKAANFFDFFMAIEDVKEHSEREKPSFFVPPDIAGALKIMGLKMPLTETSLKNRYKELAKTYHPDLNSGDKAGEEIFKEVSAAYRVLLKFIT